MLTPYMIDVEYRLAQEAKMSDFCESGPFDEWLLNHDQHGGVEWLYVELALYTSGVNCAYAQAILQSTGAIEEF